MTLLSDLPEWPGRISRFLVSVSLGLTLLMASPATGPDALAEEVLRVGTEGAYPPFNYYDKNGALTGFDTDIALALCAEMQVRCEFVPKDWPSIIDGLEDRLYDVIIASMSITKDRKKRVLFTDKYYSNALRFVGRRNSVRNASMPQSLQNVRIGAQSGSISAIYLARNHGQSAILRFFGQQEEVYNELLLGRVDYVLTDALPAYDWLQTRDGQCCSFTSEPIYADEGIAMAVRKDDAALRDRLNEALATIIANGTYSEINARYFPFSIY